MNILAGNQEAGHERWIGCRTETETAEREMDDVGEESSAGNIVARPIAITYFE